MREVSNRLAGCAGIGVGLFILTFAVSDMRMGGLFAPEVLTGASAEAWLGRVGAHPDLARAAIALPIVGFAAMLVVGLSLYGRSVDRHWAATLGLAGYLVGVPLAVTTFASGTALVWGAVASGVAGAPLVEAAALPAYTLALQRFMWVNFAVGPLFIIVTANPAMALAAWKAGVLPRWPWVWAAVNAVVMILGILSVRWPALGAAQLAGPSTMLWFVAVGVALLRPWSDVPR